MLVITLSKCPPSLRGDLTKWLFEVSPGVYIGQVNARVREALWKRIKRAAPQGQATMVWNTNNEQGLDFRVHHSFLEPIDFDGVKLMMRPNLKYQKQKEQETATPQSNARRWLQARNRAKQLVKQQASTYVVIDLETTGLKPETADIIELGALRVREGQVIEEYSTLIKTSQAVPDSVVQLTGITTDLLQAEGKPAEVALEEFAAFVGQDLVLSYNIPFDLSFVQAAYQKIGKEPMTNPTKDIFKLATKQLYWLGRYRLYDVAVYFEIEQRQQHRALADCYLAFQIYERLIQLEKEEDKAKTKLNENDEIANKKA